MGKSLLEGIIDMHVHAQPDIHDRAYTDIELMKAGNRVGAKGIVIKNHHGTSMNRAFLLNEFNKFLNTNQSKLTMYGSITLNYAIGGLNPIAVETGLKMGAKIVWLPTIHADNQYIKNGKSGGIACVVGDKVVKELKKILYLIKKYNVVLGTGHLSPHDIFIVVEEAKKIGIDKIVITHPEFWVVGMSLEEQIRITKDYDVYLERCYAQPLLEGGFKKNLEDNYIAIKEVGHKNILISTDGGQVENPKWEIALYEYIKYMLDKGISYEQLSYMTKELPSKLLNC